ncbi:MAG TPA: CsiV family protein [Pseudomonadales bacterium]|nr:CsiV family protein [Pseudomonadales bacterium]
MKLIICSLLSLALAANVARADAPAAPNYSSWFQVEIIVFAQRTPTPTDEAWIPAPLAYPAHMLAIAPSSPDQLKPGNLEELQALLASPAADTVTPEPTTDAGDEYLFEDKSRFHSRSPSVEETATQDNTPNSAQAADAAETAQVQAIFSADLPQAYRALPDDSLNLDSVARSIQRSSLYRMLLHVGWLQPIVSEDDSDPVLIQAGDRYGNDFEVDGTLTVSKSRFLHVDTDLWYTQFAKKYDEEAPLPEFVSDLPRDVLAQYPNLVAAAEQKDNYVKVQTWRMNLSRRMRSGTLHYLDNPYFGVLIEIDEFKYSPPAGAQSGSPSPSP